MRHMARQAAFGLNRRMLVNEGAGCFRMALHAHRIAGHAAMQAFLLESAVRIVTIAAAHQPLVHLVVEGLREGRFYIRVTAVAKFWL